MLQIIAFVLLAFLVLSVVLVKNFGLLGFLFVAVLFVFCLSLLQRLVGKILKRFFLAPFLAKGAVLHDAEVRVRSITPAAASAHETYDSATTSEASEQNSHDWYSLDVTITPPASSGDFTLWEPGELVLVAPDAKPDDINDAGSTLGRVQAVEVWQDGRWRADDGSKYEGPQRLKLLVAVRPGAQCLRFRYYLEIFGELDISAGPSVI